MKHLLYLLIIFSLLSIYFKAFPGPASAQTSYNGDANGDGKVDGLDYVIWINHYQSSTSRGSADGDFNFTNYVDGLDYIIWLKTYGTLSVPPTVTPKLPTPTSIPISPLPEGIYWRGDAETGNLSQWCVKNEAAPGRIKVVTSPVAQGKYAYQFNYIHPDAVGNYERVTLANGQGPDATCKYEPLGSERYYGWSVLLPAGYPNNTLWSLMVQFKGERSGSPQISLNFRDNNWMLN